MRAVGEGVVHHHRLEPLTSVQHMAASVAGRKVAGAYLQYTTCPSVDCKASTLVIGGRKSRAVEFRSQCGQSVKTWFTTTACRRSRETASRR